VILKNKQGNTEVVKKSEASGLTTVLGADFQTLSEKEARKLDLPGGVKVTHLGTGKLSSQTDMRQGFIILKVDGKPVNNVDDFNAALNDKQGGVMLEGVYPDRPGAFYYAFGM
ncbi:MAG: serine protease, partial [Runella sp.]